MTGNFVVVMSKWRWSLRNSVTMPTLPTVAMNANASGIPAKFAATPENVEMTVRIQRGVPSRIAAYAISSPRSAPSAAVTRLILIVIQYWCAYGLWISAWTFAHVAPPCADLNAPTRISPAGRKRKSSA
jgi:hypothetical protein